MHLSAHSIIYTGNHKNGNGESEEITKFNNHIKRYLSRGGVLITKSNLKNVANTNVNGKIHFKLQDLQRRTHTQIWINSQTGDMSGEGLLQINMLDTEATCDTWSWNLPAWPP